MLSHSYGFRIFVAVALLTMFSVPVFSQSVTAMLSGIVKDEQGAVVPGATVTVTDPATRLERQATTNDEGQFVVPLLPPSTYNISIERQGFATVEVPDIVLHANDRRSINIQLHVGQVGETVQVTGDPSLIDESPAVSTVVDRQFVDNLPLNGRSFQSLINLTPGVVTAPASFAQQGQFSVNGQRPDTNYFTVDGVSANIAASAGDTLVQTASGSIPGTSAQGGTNNLVSVDALQEFRIQTSTFAPEFGRTPGAQVQIVTRSGTNKFTGNVFDYFRNDVLDANDWFTNANNLKKPALRQNDFGGVLGGPIFKHRTFFFFSYEGLRLRQPVTASGVLVPSVSLRKNAAPSVQPLLNAFPIPNGRDFGFLTEYNASFSNPASLDATSIRIDHNLNSRMLLFGRYNHAPSESVSRGQSNISLSVFTPIENDTDTLTLGTTWAISANNSNELRFNYSKTGGGSSLVFDGLGGGVAPPDSLFFPSPFSSKDSVGFAQFFNLALVGVGRNADNFQRQINVVDNYSLIADTHSLKFGVDYRRLNPTLNPAAYRQVDLFSNPNDIINGNASIALIDANQPVNLLFTNFSAYGQDTWKASRRLTLTYGLRWDVNPPPSGKEGSEPFAVTGFDNFSTLAFAPRGTALYKTTYNNFAPRVGAAYQLSQKPGRETVLRGGFGVFYDMGTSSTGTLARSGNFPFGSTKLLFPVFAPLAFPLTPAQAAPPVINTAPPAGRVTVIDPNLKLPLVYQWNVAVEQSFGKNRAVSVSYVGAAGRRLIHTRSINSSSAIPRNPNFSDFVTLVSNGDTSDYHALQVQFTQRLSSGLQALASYTWAHALDSVSVDNPLFDTGNRGSSGLDVRHAFNGALTYNIQAPFRSKVGKAILGNWSVDTIVGARTAFPVDIIARSGTDSTGQPFTVRADLVSGVPIYIKDPSAPGGRRINRDAFAPPPVDAITGMPLRQGTLGRGVIRGLPFLQVDFTLRRDFKLTERVKLQFRSEFFNVFNHPNFGPPTTSLSLPSSLFGVPFQTLGNNLGGAGNPSGPGGFNPLYQIGGPRSTQFALKLSF